MTPDDGPLADEHLRAQTRVLLRDAVLAGAALGWVDPPSGGEVDDLLDDLAAGTATGRAAVRLAYDETGRLAGIGFWRRWSRPTLGANADLEKVLVSPSLRGRGLGRRLVEQLVADAVGAGIEVLTLDVRGDNVVAIGLYERLGFVECGRIEDFVGWGDQRWDRVTMQLRLPAARPRPAADSPSLPVPAQAAGDQRLHVVGWMLLQRSDGRVLLGRRARVSYGEGLWGLPGGHVEAGESWARTAARETREEVGVVVDPDALVPLGISRYDDEGVRGIDAFFRAEHWQGEPTAIAECSEVGWFDPLSLPPDSLPWLAGSLRRLLVDERWLTDLP